MKKDSSLLIVSIVLISLIIGGAFFLSRHSVTTKENISLTKASQLVLDYFNNHILKGRNIRAKIIKKEDDKKSGLYKVQIDIQGQKIDAYVSRNGHYLFPQAINLQPKATPIPKTEKPIVRLFVMAFCPFGNQAENAIIPIAKLLGNSIDFHINYIVSRDQNGKWNSLHGSQELNQDVREICAENNQPNKFLDFVEGINKDCSAKNADQCWKKVARKVGINEREIAACQEKQKDSLLQQEVKLTDKEYPVEDPFKLQGQEETTITASPTLVINNVVYTGGRRSQDYLAAICSAFKNPPPQCKTKISQEDSTPAGNCQ